MSVRVVVMAGVLVTLQFLLLPGTALAQKDNSDKVQTKTFVYKETPQAKLEIVVHYPPGWKAEDKRPAIVFFFGGGWTGGNIKQFETQANYLAGRGMVTARADYRVKGKHGVTPDKCVQDCKSAVRWLRKNAAMQGIDPQRIAAGGGSAGGHTAIASFTTEGLEPEGEDSAISSKPNLLVLFNPALDTSQFVDKVGNAEMAKKISPVHNLTKEVPPAVIFFGTDDKLLEGAQDFMVKAKKLGLKAELYLAEGQKHGFFNKSPWNEATLAQADRFLAKYGYLKGEPTLQVKAGTTLKLAAESP
jgi:acetyl esterase/lipase